MHSNCIIKEALFDAEIMIQTYSYMDSKEIQPVNPKGTQP